MVEDGEDDDEVNDVSHFSFLFVISSPSSFGEHHTIGLTFTSPNWATEPRSEVKRLTPRQPNHPASSFYYSDRETLPPIASFQFLKVT